MSGSSFFVNGGGTTLSIAANAPVAWTNDDIQAHDVTFDDAASALAVGTGGAGNFSAPVGSSNQRKFAVSGNSHPFHCMIHGLVMHGTVTVL
jgi:plastocyanin